MGNGHFANISAEIWVQSLNVYSFFGLPGDLGEVLVYYGKVGD